MSVPVLGRLRPAVFVLLAAIVALGLAVAGGVVAGAQAGARGGATTSKDIPNLGLVKNQIKLYYGDYVAADGTHEASSDSPYAKEVRQVEINAAKHVYDARNQHHHGKPALVFDVDDTTLLTYNYEVANDFGYNPAVNAEYVLGEKFPAVFGMTTVINTARKYGYAVFFVTGRPASQHDATLGNLAKVGYPAPTSPARGEDGLYTKPDSGKPFPSYVNCNGDGNPACTTIEYKSQTRKHIESLGYDIVANVGDQYSDLSGGYSDYSVKMPNPMYYLP